MPKTPRLTASDVEIRRSSDNLSLEFHASPAQRAVLDEDCAWLTIFRNAFGHEPVLLIALQDGAYHGHLPLCVMKSRLFGRFVISLPYLNTAGVRAAEPGVAHALIDHAVEVTRQAEARFLELRHEQSFDHPALTETMSSKVHMRLGLPATPEELMASLKSKRRSQLKNGLKRDFAVRWGGKELLTDFYRVFSRNMRDLGTPVYGRNLFREILTAHGSAAELCCLHDGPKPIAAALLLHRHGSTEVPSASSLREYNSSNANMAMYWHLLVRAVQRGQAQFDFGRSTLDSPTYSFKKQWGAQPSPANWQYHVRHGKIDVGRPDSARYGLAIRVWQRLPVAITNQLGPRIVRGIP